MLLLIIYNLNVIILIIRKLRAKKINLFIIILNFEEFILLKLCLLCTMNGESEINDKESLYYDIKLRKDNKDVLVANGTSYTSNCPNCGAPTKINTFGVCDHCQELISIYDSVWKIVNLKNV